MPHDLSPLRAAITEHDGETVISLEGSPVATASSEPKAISVLCAEAIRLARPLLVEVRYGRGHRYLEVDASGHATWTAGAVPPPPQTPASTDAAPGRNLIPVARPQAAPRLGYAVTSQVPTPAAPPAPTRGSALPRALAATVLAAVLCAAGAVAHHQLTEAGRIRDAVTAATTGTADQGAALRAQLPAHLSSAVLERHVREAARAHHVDVSGVRHLAPTVETLTTAAGPAEHHTTALRVTLTGPLPRVRATLTDLSQADPLVTVTGADVRVGPHTSIAVVDLAGHSVN